MTGIMGQVEIQLQKQGSKAEAGSRDQKQNRGGWGKAAKEEKGGGTTQLEPQGAPNTRAFERHPGKAHDLTEVEGGGDFHQKENRSQPL